MRSSARRGRGRASNSGGRRGFTLLESAAALVVIGLASTAALTALGAELRTAGRLRHAAAAETLARQRLATLQLLSADELRRVPDSLTRGSWAPPLDEYQWRAAVSPVVGASDLLELRVEVLWAGGSFALVTRTYAPRLERTAR